MKITKIQGREIIDSRGVPTIECCVMLSDGHIAIASVPSGASVGRYEALELRDNDPRRFNGQGVLQAIANIEQKIAPLLVGTAPDVLIADKLMMQLDETENKVHLGANATLAISMTVARAQAHMLKLDLYTLIAQLAQSEERAFGASVLNQMQLPKCMFNILNGGLHANNKVPFQEFMIMPINQPSMYDTLHVAVLVYHELKKLLQDAGYLTTVGDEGGFAPRLTGKGLSKDRMALDFVVKAVERAGFVLKKDVVLCLDVAASHFYDSATKAYCLEGECLDSAAMVEYYSELVKDYSIWSIEDGLSQDDWSGWQLLTRELGDKVCLVGDDIFVTNPQKIKQGIQEKVANAVLIKPNQIGTLSETFAALKLARDAGLKTIVSHRSGETNDSFIADFAVGAAAGYLKAGACARGERVAKYNRLLKIEAMMKK